MFEQFVQGKIDYEKNIIHGLENLSRENIINSALSDFNKNYILNETDESTDKEELVLKIEKSNKLYFNYTIRPKWTLLNFLFNKFESRPPNEVIEKLKLFPFYKYYGDAITDYIKGNSLMFVTKREVTNIVNETNNVIYEKLTSDISNLKIKNFFLQIFKLKYEEQQYNLESTIPYSFIKIFIEDKSYDELTNKFKVIGGLQEDTEFSLKDIIKVFTDKYTITEKSLEPPDATSSSKILIDIPPDKEIVKEETEYLYSEELVEASKDENKPEERGKNLIKELFDDRQLNKILNKIYNSDIIYREKSFEKLNEFRNWKEASNHLKEIFRNNNTDIYNKDVMKFVNTLNEYFHEKG